LYATAQDPSKESALAMRWRAETSEDKYCVQAEHARCYEDCRTLILFGYNLIFHKHNLAIVQRSVRTFHFIVCF
jgi:hypothetical protein